MRRSVGKILIFGLLLLAGSAAMARPAGEAASGTLHNLIHTLKDFREPPGHSRRTPAALRRQAAAFRAELQTLDARLRAGFEQTVARLQQDDMPPGLRNRHQQRVAEYQQEMTALLAGLGNLAKAGDAQTGALADQILTRLEPLQSPPKPPAFDPDNLPWRQPPAAERAPWEQRVGWVRRASDSVQADTPRAVTHHLADGANGGGVKSRQVRNVTDAPNPPYEPPSAGDLVATEDVQITRDIEDLAFTLDYHPVKIYEWTRKNIEFIPTYGSVQGSQLTLELRRGNAFDMTSLFIALLRASGIHSRYVCGTVIANTPQVISWLNVETPARAAELLAQGGIPHTVITQGGKIIKLKFEHCWAKLWVDYIPSRGAVHKPGRGDTWHPVDVAFKWYTDIPPAVNLSEAVPFDSGAVLDHLLAGVEYDAAYSRLTGLDADYIGGVFDAYRRRLDDYLDAYMFSPAVMLPRREVVYPRWSMLPSGLPFRVKPESAPMVELPEHFRHQLTVKLYRNATDQALDSPSLRHTISLPKLNSRRLSLSWEPAGEEDAQGLAAFQAEAGRTELPVFVFNLKPVLKLDEEILATGAAVQMGTPQYYSLQFQDPNFSHGSQGVLTAGDETVIGVNGNGLAPAVINARIRRVAVNSSNLENLHQTALHFWAEHDLLDGFAARDYGVRVQRMPSAGLFSSPLTVTYVLGMPQRGSYRERRIDVKHNVQTVAAADPRRRFEFMSRIGVHGSHLEASVLEQLYGHSGRGTVSAADILVEADRQGIAIYHVTPANAGTVLPELAVSAAVRDDIRRAVAAGKHVIVPHSDLRRGDWVGTGYIVQDPLTGAGAYLLDGGYNGGTWEGCEISVLPVPGMFAIKDALFGMFDTMQLQLEAVHDLAPTPEAKAQVNERFDDEVTLFMTVWRSILSFHAVTGQLTVFKIRDTHRDDNPDADDSLPRSGCLVPKTRPSEEHPAGPFDPTGFEQYHYLTVPQELDFMGFGVGGVICRNYRWQIVRHEADGSETPLLPEDNPDYQQEFIRYLFGEADAGFAYTADVSAQCEGSAERLYNRIKVYLPKLELTAHRPKVLDPAQTPVSEAEEETVGVQTFVNVDNDDADNLTDLEDPEVRRAGGQFDEDELVMFTVKLLPDEPEVAAEIAREHISVTTGGEAEKVKLWTSEYKGGPPQQYTPGTELPFHYDDDTAYLWMEAVDGSSHTRSVSLEAVYALPPVVNARRRVRAAGQVPQLRDKCAATNLQIDLVWHGRGNGYHLNTNYSTATAHVHDNDSLLDDSASGYGNNGDLRRVFVGGRAPNYSQARDAVDLEVILQPAPTDTVEVFVRSFDLDDPASHDTHLDPNDNGSAGNYSGTGAGSVVPVLTYTAENDNRGEVGANKYKEGLFECADRNGVAYTDCTVLNNTGYNIAKITFKKDVVSKKIGFRMSRHPGDNYKVAAACEVQAVQRLRNLDQHDQEKVKDPQIAGEYRFTSKALEVWRLLHIERDALLPLLEQENSARGHIGKIEIIQATERATNLTHTVQKISLSDKEGSELYLNGKKQDTLDDGSPASGDPEDGRFQDGTIKIAGHDAVNADLWLNTPNYFLTTQTKFLLVPFTVQAAGTEPALSGTISAFSHSWWFGEYTNLAVRVSGAVANGISADSLEGRTMIISGGTKLVYEIDDNSNPGSDGTFKIDIKSYLLLNFVALDDDTILSVDLPLQDMSVMEKVYGEAYILPVADGGGLGTSAADYWISLSPHLNLDLLAKGLGAGMPANIFLRPNELLDRGDIYKIYLDALNADSYPNARSTFWIVQIINAYQGALKKDNDPNKEPELQMGITLAHTHHDMVVSGGDISFIYRESIREIMQEHSVSGNSYILLTEAHELGHQLGLGHNYQSEAASLMAETVKDVIEDINARNKHLLRSQICVAGVKELKSCQ